MAMEEEKGDNRTTSPGGAKTYVNSLNTFLRTHAHSIVTHYE